MLKFVFFLLASFVTSNLALADGHETAIADPAEISFVFNTFTQDELLQLIELTNNETVHTLAARS